ncbi:MAG: LysR family transcriptional regulator [Cocleimonas sp.]|nr:LysR family transcriptional regulator [Cocleimonas sp.]
MDRLNAMNLYCHIVETGQLSLAADHLNISKGAVSKQLAKLEAHLGGRLLNRTTRRLTPTEAGIAFYDRAKLILESVEEAECVVSGLTAEPRGTLKINAPMSFGVHHMGKLLAKYQQKYPKVIIDISLNDRQIDLIEEGYDLALRIATLKDSSLIARKLAPCHIVLCASATYLKQYGEPQTPSDLKNHHCIRYAYTDSVKHWMLEDSKGKKQQVIINSLLVSNNGNLICDAVIHGMGIAALPTFIVGDAIRKGEANIILDEWRPQTEDISLLYPSSKHLSAKVRTFVDMAVEHFKPLKGKRNEWDHALPL